jgi:hypothetical protein
VVRAAVPAFAAALGVRPPLVELTVPAPGQPVLVLHAAALVAVLEARSPGEAVRVVADLGVLDALLRHEGRYWQGSADAAGLADLDTAVRRRAVAAACLVGAGDEAEAAGLLARVPDLDGASELLRRRAARWLRQLYPARPPAWLGSLEPDLLAERQVADQLSASPELGPPLPGRLRRGADMQGAHSPGPCRRPPPGGAQDPRTRLAEDLAGLGLPMVEVAIRTGGASGSILTEALARTTAEDATFGAIDLLPAERPPIERARWQVMLGSYLLYAGQGDEAVRSAAAGVDTFRRLVESDRERYLTGLPRPWSISPDTWP